MIITRPYNAEDNNLNKLMFEVLKKHTDKIGETIKEVYIYECCVSVITQTGREFITNQTDGCYGRQANVKYIYMKERINGKQFRIKRADW